MQKCILLSLAAASSAYAATYSCEPAQPAACNRDSCSPCFCLGPDNVHGNAPVNPRTCNGDFMITVAGLYWRAEQDGMEYAIQNSVDSFTSLSNSNNLIDATYRSPKSSWEGGIRVAIGYASPCDGWDINLTWTYFDGQASSHDQVELNHINNIQENEVLLPLWSAFHGGQESFAFGIVTAADIQTNWDAEFHILDLELGRNYWTSKYLTMRPFIALRYVNIEQDYNLLQLGGSWSSLVEDSLSDEVKLDNDFRAIGPRAGFDLNWHFGCGWSLYSEFAASLVYGRFSLDHDESVRQTVSPFSKGKVLDTSYRFHASRAILDIVFGLQYATLVCDCKYGITVQLGWEQHMFFHQNQMWRVNRIGTDFVLTPFRSNSGENDFQQRRGTLSTHGWTLSFKFDF